MYNKNLQITIDLANQLKILHNYLKLIQTNALNPQKILDYTNLCLDSSNNAYKDVEDLLNLSNNQQLSSHNLDRENKWLLSFITENLNKIEYLFKIKKINLNLIVNFKSTLKVKFDFIKLENIINEITWQTIKHATPNQTINIKIGLKSHNVEIETQFTTAYFTVIKEKLKHIPSLKINQKNVLDSFMNDMHNIESRPKLWNWQTEVDDESQKKIKYTLTLLKSNPTKEKPIAKEKIISKYTFANNVTSSGIQPFKILIIENQIDTIKYYYEILYHEFNIYFAFSIPEAYTLIEKQDFDLIVCNRDIPLISGEHFKNILDTDPRTTHIKFIITYHDLATKDIRNDRTENNFIYHISPIEKPILLKYIEDIKIKKGHQNNFKQIEQLQDTNSFLYRFNSYIVSNLHDNNLKISKIAADLGYSQKELGILIKKYTGKTTAKAIQDIRILKAYEYIKLGKHKDISSIMFAVGFSSRAHFYKIFEERFGVKVGHEYKKYHKT